MPIAWLVAVVLASSVLGSESAPSDGSRCTLPGGVRLAQPLATAREQLLRACVETEELHHTGAMAAPASEQHQINCSGLSWLGAERRIELMFNDGALAFLWVLVQADELPDLERTLVRQLGEVVYRDQGYSAFGRGCAALRSDPPEILYAVPDMMREIAGFAPRASAAPVPDPPAERRRRLSAFAPQPAEPSNNGHPSVSPDGEWILFDSDRSGGGDIYVMRANGADLRRLTDHPAPDMGAIWWDAGKSVLFQSFRGQRHAQVWLMDPGGGNVRRAPEPRAMHWDESRDGEWMLTGPLTEAEKPLIWIQRADGSERRLLTSFREGSFNSDMSFAPDGRHVVFESFIGTVATGGIYVVDTAGGRAERIADGTDPSWSPDGLLIAFKVHDTSSDRYDLHVIDAGGDNQRVLGEGTIPRWFPDSRRLAFMAPVEGHWQIHVIDLDAGETIQLTR